MISYNAAKRPVDNLRDVCNDSAPVMDANEVAVASFNLIWLHDAADQWRCRGDKPAGKQNVPMAFPVRPALRAASLWNKRELGEPPTNR